MIQRIIYIVMSSFSFWIITFWFLKIIPIKLTLFVNIVRILSYLVFICVIFYSIKTKKINLFDVFLNDKKTF
jgi:hypothetical protein